jgi:lipid-binding SYLF domain-containing protein
MTSAIRKKKGLLSALVVAAGVIGSVLVDTVEAQDRRRDADVERINDSTKALAQVASLQDNGIPRAVLERAEGIIIFPRPLDIPRRRGQGPNTLRTARRLDIRSRGIFSVRTEKGNWSPPAFLALAGGNPPEDADLVFVVVNRSGLDNLMRREFDLDATPIVAPGPVDSNTQAWTDIQRSADILIYSLSRGKVTGISLSGSAVQADTFAHQRFYGKALTTAAAIEQTESREPVPAWLSALEKHTGR